MKPFFLFFSFLLIAHFSFSQIFSGVKHETRSLYNLSMPFFFENGKPITTLPRFSLSNIEYRYYKGWGKPGLFMGIGTHNLGAIIREGDTTFKRRVQTLFPQAGFRLGLKKGGIYLGAAVDCAIHYKEKKIVGKWKSKESEFFSPQTARWLPSIFLGTSYGIMDIRIQYYITDFLNTKRPEFANIRGNIVNMSLAFNRLYLKDLLKKIPTPTRKNKEPQQTNT